MSHAVAYLALRLTAGDKDPIRGLKLADGSKVFSIYDTMWNTGDFATRDAVTGAWTRLLKMGFKHEIAPLKYIQFAGRGQRKTPCSDVSGLLKIMSHINFNRRKAFWHEAQLVLERYLDGDTSMCVEVEENKRVGGDEARARFALKVETLAAEMQEDNEVGYVYGMVSDAFPGHVKIGCTHNLAQRLAQANTFCALKPFRYVATRQTAAPHRLEKKVHAHFADCRRAGEFFEIDVEAVTNLLSSIQE